MSVFRSSQVCSPPAEIGAFGLATLLYRLDPEAASDWYSEVECSAGSKGGRTGICVPQSRREGGNFRFGYVTTASSHCSSLSPISGDHRRRRTLVKGNSLLTCAHSPPMTSNARTLFGLRNERPANLGRAILRIRMRLKNL